MLNVTLFLELTNHQEMLGQVTVFIPTKIE